MHKFEILVDCIINNIINIINNIVNNSNLLRDSKNLERKEIRKFNKGKGCAEHSRFLYSISKNVIVDYHQCKLIFRILFCELSLDFIVFILSFHFLKMSLSSL